MKLERRGCGELRQTGLESANRPCGSNPGGGKKRGTALMVPTCVGVKKLDDQKKWDISPKTCGGRLVMAALQTRGLGWMQVFVCYFVCWTSEQGGQEGSPRPRVGTKKKARCFFPGLRGVIAPTFKVEAGLAAIKKERHEAAANGGPASPGRGRAGKLEADLAGGPSNILGARHKCGASNAGNWRCRQN